MTFKVAPAPSAIVLVVVFGKMVIVLVPALMALMPVNAPRLLTEIEIGLLLAELFKFPVNAPPPKMRVPVPVGNVAIVVPELPLAVTVVVAVLPIVILPLPAMVLRFTVSAEMLPLRVIAPPDFNVTLLPAVPVMVLVVDIAPVPPVVTMSDWPFKVTAFACV